MGDFLWEIEKNKEENTLYIFNDNVEHHEKDNRGDGSAKIRPYNSYGNGYNGKIRSAGIATGKIRTNGFETLKYNFTFKGKNYTAQKIIDEHIDEIKVLLKTGNYNKVKYSGDKNRQLGSKIFKKTRK